MLLPTGPGAGSRHIDDGLRSTVSPDAHDGHGETQGGQAGALEEAPGDAVELVAVDVAEDLVAGLEVAWGAGGRRLLPGGAGRGGGRLGQQAGGGGGEDGEERGVDEVGVAGGARGQGEGEEEGRGGEGGEGQDGQAEVGGEGGEGVRAARGRGEVGEGGEREGRDGVRDALGQRVLAILISIYSFVHLIDVVLEMGFAEPMVGSPIQST